MSQSNGNEARKAASEACEYCKRIASALGDSIRQAERLQDHEMVDRLMIAKARADRATELVDRLVHILERQPSDKLDIRR